MKYVVTVNDKNYEVEVEKGEARVLSVAVAAPVIAAPAAVAAPTPVTAAPAASSVDLTAGTPLPAPMPGTILSVQKKAGDRVKTGDVIVILEAMKMENEIVAMKDGIISQILVSKGTSVTTGDPLVLIA